MTKSKMFQYCVIFSPTEKQEKEGMKAKILVDVKNVLAQDQNSVAMMAAMEIPAEYKDQLDQIDIAIRPF